MTVNVGTGTPQEAAAWVHYANVVQGYGIHYWQIGNEMEGSWETGGPLNAQDYVQRYLETYDAMKAEDPTIVILGPVAGAPNDPSNLPDGNAFIQDFLEILHAGGSDDHVDAIDFHWYPNWGPVSDATALAAVSQLGDFAATLKSWISTTAVKSDVPVFLTEYNVGLGAVNTPVYANQLVNGLWVANVLGEFTRNFGGHGGTNLWNMMSGWTTTDISDPTVGDLGYLQHDVNAYRYQAHADYWAMQMMSSDWAIAGDTLPHSLVTTASSQFSLAAYADLRPDGALALAVINKDETNAYDATIQIGPFALDATADVWTFDARNYVWETATAPYHAEPDSAPTHTVTCGASASTPITFPPASITVLRFAPQGSLQAPSSDAGPDANSPTPVAVTLIDDMSGTNGAEISLVPQYAGDIAGYWYTTIGGGADATDLGSIFPLAASETPDGAAASFEYSSIGSDADSGIDAPPDAGNIMHAACASGQTPAAQYAYAAEGFAFELTPTDAGAIPRYVDISSYKGLEFWTYNALATPTVLRVQIPDQESDPDGGVCGMAPDASALDQCGAPVFEDLVIAPGWSVQQVPFSALGADPNYGYPQPMGGDMTTATGVLFQINQPQAIDAGGGPVIFDFCIADVEFFD
jgi:hypothetical protein